MNNSALATSTATSTLYAPSYSKLLSDYLRDRPATQGAFYISEWLDVIHEDTLHGLDECIEQVIDGRAGSKAALSDLVMLCDAVLAAEGRGICMPTKPKGVIRTILNLQIIGATVAIAKHGFIKLHNPLALSSKGTFRYSITQHGRRIGTELGLITQK